jgi:hypothetical protein
MSATGTSSSSCDLQPPLQQATCATRTSEVAGLGGGRPPGGSYSWPTSRPGGWSRFGVDHEDRVAGSDAQQLASVPSGPARSRNTPTSNYQRWAKHGGLVGVGELGSAKRTSAAGSPPAPPFGIPSREGRAWPLIGSDTAMLGRGRGRGGPASGCRGAVHLGSCLGGPLTGWWTRPRTRVEVVQSDAVQEPAELPVQHTEDGSKPDGRQQLVARSRTGPTMTSSPRSASGVATRANPR